MDARSECDIVAAEKGPSSQIDGLRAAGLVSALHKIFTNHNTLNIQSVSRLECTGSCPDLMMSRREAAEPPPATLTPQLPPRAHHHHRPLCMSVSSDSSGRFKALDTQEWKNNLKAQMEQAHSAGAARSTGSLERASLFCAAGGPPSKATTGRFSLFSPPWNVSSESDSNPPSRSGSRKLRNYSRRAATGPADAHDPPGGEGDGGGGGAPRHFEPVISKVTDYIYVGNLNAAYNGRALCRNNIDSIIDMSGAPGQAAPALSLIPCTCSRGGVRHSWSRLKVDIGDVKQRCFEDINECIHASAGKRKRVLVHCGDGFSLAPTCVIQYLMLKRNMRLMAAYELLRAKYPVNIRECHRNLLVSLERTLRPGDVDPESFKQAISRKVAWT
ncbi:uncharacterized protein LOC119124195 isoform X1 [Syngnathus acus]|uniref:uncharacterized protein LOC119124195 isoform X1 n=1 Tax=Syngnathus acus TaxID=161584 RepID=UPI001886396A|nr:uncharacterized protein LOC119124195 isoform X1 [Syngnathus acus]XP_037109803.1 uncharacterized protein LOC119124195 isoform X1 [Syngnathus acus]XP_037109804.1 uncharacterized protein LOC119124195 isoform X1 [Syngnathus acus]XP_037109805.1 uncharacterized protein LOC119124195 isoform X1 [Syngnathus acus]